MFVHTFEHNSPINSDHDDDVRDPDPVTRYDAMIELPKCVCNASDVTPPNGLWTGYVSGGVTLLSISSTKHKEQPLR
nr:hypothetical protein [Tanacetum cinerariifolium]